MRHVTSSGIALALLLACQNAPTAPSSPDFAAGGNSQRFPFDNIIPVPCVNGGAGESVEITGTMHLVVVDQPGVFHVGENLQGATGLGLTTGVVYRAAGGNLEFTLIPNHAETFVSTFRLIGPGLAANLTVREVFHATINANGVATVTFDKATEECKQG